MKNSLSIFIEEQQESEKEAFLKIMNGIKNASAVIDRAVNRAGLTDILGAAGSENIQGETQQKLDVFADEEFIKEMRATGVIAGVASEENDDFLAFEGMENGEFIVLFDPLDGSSNIDVNVSIGTIFSIYKRNTSGKAVELTDFLRPGAEQFASGYVLYGSSTMLVYTSGKGVNGFTFDNQAQDFFLSHPNMRMPENGKTFSLNEGNLLSFPTGIQQFVTYCKTPDSETNRPYGARYIGSMVADFHRNLIKGGIFIYPSTEKAPSGKLRLLYECNPLALIIREAGGFESTGQQSILDLEVKELHQRTPVILGSKNLVEKVHSML